MICINNVIPRETHTHTTIQRDILKTLLINENGILKIVQVTVGIQEVSCGVLWEDRTKKNREMKNKENEEKIK